MPNEKGLCKYPNGVREAREAMCLTRRQLSELTRRMEAVDPVLNAGISEEGIKALEAGWSKPRLRTMATLARVLGKAPTALFPMGADNGARNREGLPTTGLS